MTNTTKRLASKKFSVRKKSPGRDDFRRVRDAVLAFAATCNGVVETPAGLLCQGCFECTGEEAYSYPALVHPDGYTDGCYNCRDTAAGL